MLPDNFPGLVVVLQNNCDGAFTYKVVGEEVEYIGRGDLSKDYTKSPHMVKTVDFEELFPGYLYEVFGVQFRLPDLGTNYSYYLDNEEEAPSLNDPYAPPPIADEEDRLFELLVLMEATDVVFHNRKDLSKHYRKLSLKYHPLKHLQASEEEKEAIAARYTEITSAYNDMRQQITSDEHQDR